MENFTLIIPSHNRHNYLKRSTDYYSKLNAKVIYCDSSELPYTGHLNPNMEYLHLPNNKFAEKIITAINLTTTDYVALCADDDFILINTLYDGCKQLSGNKEISTIVGRYVSFNEDFDGKYTRMYEKGQDIINHDPNSRAIQFFRNYYQILWSMYPKQNIYDAFTIINQSQFKNDNFIELIIGALSCYLGNIIILNDIWGIREKTKSDHWGKRHTSISKINKLELSEDMNKIRSILDKYTTYGYSDLILESYLSSHLKKSKSIISLIKKIIPTHLLKILKENRGKINKKNNHVEYISDEEYNLLQEITQVIEHNSDKNS